MEMKPDVDEQNFHVLAVDDSVLDRKLLERLLKVSSYQVTCVESGDKALEYLGLLKNDLDLPSHSTPSSSSSRASSSSSLSSPHYSSPQEGLKVNLIITDYCMPGMSGYDLLKRVKGSLWKDVPVVVMSSENVPSRINMCLEGGAEEFLLKPVQLSDVEKLQPYVLKSVNKNSLKRKNSKNSEEEEEKEEKMSHKISKRKAVSPTPAQETKPNKLKGFGIV